MHQHSPEPWRVEKRNAGQDDEYIAIVDANGNDVISVASTDPGSLLTGAGELDIAEADAERIVACVNACVGWTKEELTAQWSEA